MLKLIIETCVHRRVAALVMTAIIAAFGIRAYLKTPIEAFPDVTNAQVQVITQMPGYASEEIERRVTVPLERVLNGTPGMTLLRSESLFGLSIVSLVFDDDADPFTSRMVVGQRLTQADLPEGITPSLAPEATPLGKIYRFRIDQRPARPVPAALGDAVERHARAAPGAGRGRCRALWRLPQGVAHRGRPGAPLCSRHHAGQPGGGDHQGQPERGRRFSAPRRPGAHHPRRGLSLVRRGPQEGAAQGQGWHRPHPRRRGHHQAGAHAAARLGGLERAPRGGRRACADATRGEPLAGPGRHPQAGGSC